MFNNSTPTFAWTSVPCLTSVIACILGLIYFVVYLISSIVEFYLCTKWSLYLCAYGLISDRRIERWTNWLQNSSWIGVFATMIYARNTVGCIVWKHSWIYPAEHSLNCATEYCEPQLIRWVYFFQNAVHYLVSSIYLLWKGMQSGLEAKLSIGVLDFINETWAILT